MAKAKKSSGESKGTKGKSTSNQPAPTGMPLIDTSSAAESAARFIANRAKLGVAVGASETPAHESASFRQLKKNVLKPQVTGLEHVLPETPEHRSSVLHDATRRQTGHNQVTSGPTNRTGVPRRTAG
jgi:hypothetical protein